MDRKPIKFCRLTNQNPERIMSAIPIAKHASRSAVRRDGIRRRSKPVVSWPTTRTTSWGFPLAGSKYNLTKRSILKAKRPESCGPNGRQEAGVNLGGLGCFSGVFESKVMIVAPAPAPTSKQNKIRPMTVTVHKNTVGHPTEIGDFSWEICSGSAVASGSGTGGSASAVGEVS